VKNIIIKPRYPKTCVICLKNFIGLKNQKRCPECLLKEKEELRKRTHCSKCGRFSRRLKNGLCSFCKKILRENPEKKHRHRASEIEILKCPKCKSTRRELKETENLLMIVCSECGCVLAQV